MQLAVYGSASAEVVYVSATAAANARCIVAVAAPYPGADTGFSPSFGSALGALTLTLKTKPQTSQVFLAPPCSFWQEGQFLKPRHFFFGATASPTSAPAAGRLWRVRLRSPQRSRVRREA